MNIILSESPSKEDLKVISNGIKTFNQLHIPDEVVFEEDTSFAVFAKNKDGKVCGGIRANAYWNYCIIELLWLADDLRGQSIGTQLMNEVEKFAIKKGFEYIRTETVSFQAKGFYEKMGYKVFGVLEEYPKGHTTYCVVKKLI